jgi:hypothetical protein
MILLLYLDRMVQIVSVIQCGFSFLKKLLTTCTVLQYPVDPTARCWDPSNASEGLAYITIVTGVSLSFQSLLIIKITNTRSYQSVT